VTCKVTYDGSDDESKAIPLLQSTYTVTWLAEVKFIPTLLHSSNGVVVSPDGRRVYVAVGGGGRTAIYVIDTATDAIIHSASYDIQSSGHLAIHPDGSRLYLDLIYIGIAVISTTSFARVATYATGNEHIVDMAINTAGTRLYVTARSGAYTYDAATGNRIAQIAGQSYFIARSPNNTRAYLTTYGGGFNPVDTTVINTANNSVVTVIQGTRGPMALSTNTPRLYFARGDGLGIINTNTNSLVTVIEAGSGTSVAVNPVLPHAYTAGYRAFNIFDTNTDRLIATVPVDIEFDSAAIAVLPNGSKAYFTSRDSQGLYVMRY
jgi:DNA-binding beta-propeller fold protein YncE